MCNRTMKAILIIQLCIVICIPIVIDGFTVNNIKSTSFLQHKATNNNSNKKSSNIKLLMNVDPITSLRTEWISAALCTNQTPRSADVALQLGCNDGRAVMFLPRTIRKLITSSSESTGEISVSVKRQLNQQKKQRFGSAEESFGGIEVSDRMIVDILDQRADDLKLVPDESVDVVLSLQSAENMLNNGLDWKQSINEAIRVLKPNGRLLFVEKTELNYLEYLIEQEGIIWDSIGYDDVDLVIMPHVAGVAIKSVDAGLTDEQRRMKAKQMEKDAQADLAINMFEKGGAGRRKKKKKKKNAAKDDSASETPEGSN